MAIHFGKSKATSTPPTTKKSGTVSSGFMKKGQQAKKALEHEEEVQHQRETEKGKMRRFWVPKGEDTYITFLDGDITEEGFLDVPMYYEHQVYMNGSWGNHYPCLKNLDTDAVCPICETPAPGNKGTYYASLVAALTVIDHSEYTANNGTVYKDQKKLFIAKRETIALLTKKAKKIDGLRYATFEVSRIGERAPNVGSAFDLEKQWTPKELEAEFGDILPANYDEEIIMADYDSLRKLGFGGASIGAETGVNASSYKDEL